MRLSRTVVGAALGLAATVITLVACEMAWVSGLKLDSKPPDAGVIVGDISISRDEMDPQRYVLALHVLNQRSTALEGMTLVAVVSAATPDEDRPHLSTRIRVVLETSVAPDVRLPVRVSMESPFTVVPPGPLTLTEIRVGRFVFASDTGATIERDTWIDYLWPVEEHS